MHADTSLGERFLLHFFRYAVDSLCVQNFSQIFLGYEMVKITGKYEGALACRTQHGPSGAELVTDAPVDNGGKGLSYSPTDLVATALGACIMTIMGLVAERHSVDLTGMTFEVEKGMMQQPVRRIGTLNTIISIPEGVCEDLEIRKKIETAAGHCPVHQSIHPEIDAPIEFRWL